MASYKLKINSTADVKVKFVDITALQTIQAGGEMPETGLGGIVTLSAVDVPTVYHLEGALNATFGAFSVSLLKLQEPSPTEIGYVKVVSGDTLIITMAAPVSIVPVIFEGDGIEVTPLYGSENVYNAMRDGIPDNTFTPVPDQSVSHVLMNPDVAGQTFVYFFKLFG